MPGGAMVKHTDSLEPTEMENTDTNQLSTQINIRVQTMSVYEGEVGWI